MALDDCGFDLAKEIQKEIDKEIIRELVRAMRLEQTTVDEDGNVIEPDDRRELDWLI